ncbi:MAG TPA: hypothetical protein VM689_11680 [Aliidongia sp.]|nr:hypothetical protein [Aliidongia sp.]
MPTPAERHAAEAKRLAKEIRERSLSAGEDKDVASRRELVAKLAHLAEHSTDGRQRASSARELPGARGRLAAALGVEENDMLVYAAPAPAGSTIGAAKHRRGRPPGRARRPEAAAPDISTAAAPAGAPPASAELKTFAELIADRLRPARPRSTAPAPLTVPPAALAPAAAVPISTASGSGGPAPAAPGVSPARAALAVLEARRRGEGPAGGPNVATALKAALVERDAQIEQREDLIARQRHEIAHLRRQLSGEGATLRELAEAADASMLALLLRIGPRALKAAGILPGDAFQLAGNAVASARARLRELPKPYGLPPIPTVEPEPQPPTPTDFSGAQWDHTDSWRGFKLRSA